MVFTFFRAAGEHLKLVPSEKADSVLEIGAGCEPLLNVLPQKFTYDFRGAFKNQADIIIMRNRDKENLTIMAGNLNDMTFPKILTMW